MNIVEMFRARAAAYPDEPAIIDARGSTTFAKMETASAVI